MSICWATFYSCLPRCMQSSCCAPTARNVSFVTPVQTINAVAISTVSRTLAPSPRNDQARLPAISRILATSPQNRPLTPDPEVDGALERIADIHARQVFSRLTSYNHVVNVNSVINENKDGAS